MREHRMRTREKKHTFWQNSIRNWFNHGNGLFRENMCMLVNANQLIRLPVSNGHIQHNRLARHRCLPKILGCSHRRLAQISFGHTPSRYSPVLCILSDCRYANLCIQCLIHQIWIDPLYHSWIFNMVIKSKGKKNKRKESETHIN